MPVYFFDTGVLNNVFHRDSPGKEKTFWHSARGQNLFAASSTYSTFTTPCQLIEVLSLQKDISLERDSIFHESLVQEINDYGNDDFAHLFQKIFCKIKARLSGLPFLAQEKLLSTMDSEIGWRSPEAKNLFQEAFYKPLVNREPLDYFYENLALNQIQSLDFDKMDRVKAEGLLKHILLNAFSIFTESSLNISFAKAFNRFYSLHSTTSHLTRAFDYKSDNEYVDAEMVHFALVGKLGSGKNISVTVFTTENLSNLTERISAYKALVIHFKNFLKTENRISDFSQGKLVSVDQRTGEIKEVQSVDIQFDDFAVDTTVENTDR